MKKLSFAVKTLIGCFLIGAAATSCSQKAATPVAAEAPVAAEVAVINIRYVNYDTIMVQYKLAQEIAQENQSMMVSYQRLEQQKQNEIQKLGTSIENKRNANGYLSEASFQADVNNLTQKQNEAARLLQTRQEQISRAMTDAGIRLNDSIQNFINIYNAGKGYDAILLREAGLYFNPQLDITAEVIEGLNARYTEASK